MAREYLVRRGEILHYRRRVPGEVAVLDPRGEIWISTHKSDETEAVIIARRISGELESYWSALSAGEQSIAPAARQQFDRAVRLARTLGVVYRPVHDLAAGDLSEIVHRSACPSRAAQPNGLQTDGVGRFRRY